MSAIFWLRKYFCIGNINFINFLSIKITLIQLLKVITQKIAHITAKAIKDIEVRGQEAKVLITKLTIKKIMEIIRKPILAIVQDLS
ncbi:hypothetical protein J6W20_05900 [bacterium]|nr:hypothetical protein [bacterium]